MGKSTAAGMLEHLGIPVHDSDAAVHDLLQPGSEAFPAIRKAFPRYKHPRLYKASMADRRKALGKIVFNNDKARQILESILHPLVRKSQDSFIRLQRNTGRDIIALDIPLLFETGAEQRVDYTIAITAPEFIQEQRVLSRPNMTRQKFQNILKSQMPSDEKCARADFVVPSGLGRAASMKALKQIIHDLRCKEEEDAA